MIRLTLAGFFTGHEACIGTAFADDFRGQQSGNASRCRGMRRSGPFAAAAVIAFGIVACGGRTTPTSPAPTNFRTTVRFVYRASTIPRTDLSPSARACVEGVGRTHIHPSWRNFDRFEMTPVGTDRWETGFVDVPVNTRQSIRVSDGNACDENPTGAATRNVFANDVRLVDIVPTPGSGTEPGLAFTVSADGRVTP